MKRAPLRLRDRPLSRKPRIVSREHGGYYVEHSAPSSHPAMYTQAKCIVVDSFQEAIAKALEWAGPKLQEPTC